MPTPDLDNNGMAWARRADFLAARLAPTEGDCWSWTGAKHYSPAGGGPYGRAAIGKKGEQWYAHRLAWAVHRGDIPSGMHLDHLCFNTLCVNPDHLDPVPASVNSARSAERYRTLHPQCPRGHDEWVYRKSNGTRYCAECNRIRARANKRKRASNV